MRTSFSERKIPSVTTNYSLKEPNRALIFEVGTGTFVGEIANLFQITSMKFSFDGKYLSFGSSSGIISVWATNEAMSSNITEVLNQVKLKDDFWKDYPIYLNSTLNDDYTTVAS
jgi:WD40 repeat protein